MAEKPEAASPSASEGLPPPHHPLQNHLVAVYVANEPSEYGYTPHRPYANGEECLVTYHQSGVVGEPPAPSPSSCSSLSSSTDEGGGAISGSAHQEVVLYEGTPSVVGRNAGGVVLAVRQQQQGSGGQVLVQHHHPVQQQQQQFVTVPYGWKRILSNGSIVYISPSNTVLSSPEQVKEYLLTAGTCKCGLECHFKYDNTFNFDPKVGSKPWILSPDTNTGDLTKLCNHKRKIIAMATAIDRKPLDPNIKLRKDYNVKRKKRKIGLPYSAGGISVSQILAHREKIALNQHGFNKDLIGNQQQVWQQPSVMNRLHGYPEPVGQPHHVVRCHQDQQPNRLMATGGQPVVMAGADGSTIVVQQPANPAQGVAHNHPSSGAGGQVVGSAGGSGPFVNVQSNQNGQQGVVNFVNAAGPGQGQNQQHQQQHRVFINGQPSEPSGPGRPNLQMIPVTVSNQPANQEMRRGAQNQPQNMQNVQFYSSPSNSVAANPTQCPAQTHQAQSVRQFNPNMNGYRPQMVANAQMQQQKVHWQNKMVAQHQHQQQMHQQQMEQAHLNQPNSNVYERVPPLHQHSPSSSTQAVVWQEEIKRKKAKMGKVVKSRPYHMIESSCHPPCPNIDVRQIPMESRSVIINQLPPHSINNQTSSSSSSSSSSPSFMEDPSGYLAQQTALLNNTINRQTGANGCTGYICNSPLSSDLNCQPVSQHSTNEMHLPSNMVVSSHIKQQPQQPPPNVGRSVQQVMKMQQPMQQQPMPQQSQPYVADSSVSQQSQQCMVTHCQGCMAADSMQQQQQQFMLKTEGSQQQMQHHRLQHSHSRPNSTPGTPSSTGITEDPVTSSTFTEKLSPSQSLPDTRPIQGGTVSTSNVSPAAGGADGLHSDPPTPQTPNSQSASSTGAEQRQSSAPTPPRRTPDTSQQQYGAGQVQSHPHHVHREGGYQQKQETQGVCCQHAHPTVMGRAYTSGVVTTMASGRTVGSNTITSVLAGRANTATVSINSPSSSTPTSLPNQNTMPITVNVSKSPLEMVQSVVSSIQVPHSQHQQSSNSQMSPQIVKHSPTGLPPGHIFVSSGGQLIVTASNGQQSGGVMAPPPPKILTNQSGMPPISVSPMVTNVTASVTQVIPAVAQQVLGQQTVLVNALPAPFVLQPGVTMTMDGTTVANMQIPQLVAAGNVIQQQIQIDNTGGDPRRAVPALLSPDTKKKGKKRKVASQTVAGMLHIAAQQNQGMVMSQQGFPQQIQMAHSPQGITTGPVMQALTIVPSKTGGPAQIVMNGQAIQNTNLGTQQLITNSQPAQQINLLQPVNLINSATGVVQNFPAIQQFIVPNLGGSMVMNPDGTATILQDTSNIGMQLQIQNVNGQNVLTPVQNSNVFNGGQSILAAGPAGMVIRAPASATSQGKILQQQQHSPGAATQFLSPNSAGQFVVNAAGAQFNGQLSPLVASVSPSQQVTFSTSPQQQIRPSNSQQQDYIQMNGQMGQTLMVPCSLAPANIAVSSSNQQNTTFVQQNTTIVQQQTTMVANNQQIQNFQQQQQTSGSQSSQQQQQQQHPKTTATLSLDQHNYIISSNDSKQHQHQQNHPHPPQQMQAVVVEQRESPKNINYRQSVSTQTAVNQQNSQSVTTNTFCQTSTISASVSSPPDTTTLSPIAAGGQSPPTVDTTTHSGSTDDGLSPAPSNASIGDGSAGRPHSCTMAMVHCISSSEPDSADLSTQCTGESEWQRRMSSGNAGHHHHHHQSGGSGVPKVEYMDVTSGHSQHDRKQTTIPTHVAFAESSTVVSGVHYITTHDKEAVASSRSYEKQQQHRRRMVGGETIVVVEDHHRVHHTSLFDDDDEEKQTRSPTPTKSKSFSIGDLVWGPANGLEAWPGKIVGIEDETVLVKWFGIEKSCEMAKADRDKLRTLTEGLDEHHRQRKKSRTSRKLNGQLEKAIQEAMSELDKPDCTPLEEQGMKTSPRKLERRLRSSQR